MSEPLDLDAIEARVEAATAGPWHGEHDEFGCVHVGDYGWVASGPQGQSPDYDGGTGDQGKADAEFIAHAREDVPALVAEVRRLRAQVPKRPPEQIARPSNAARGGAVVNIMFDPVPTRMVPVPVPSHRCPRCGYGR